jgi:hypothetical protein
MFHLGECAGFLFGEQKQIAGGAAVPSGPGAGWRPAGKPADATPAHGDWGLMVPLRRGAGGIGDRVPVLPALKNSEHGVGGPAITTAGITVLRRGLRVLRYSRYG